jgi:hypothetical protein
MFRKYKTPRGTLARSQFSRCKGQSTVEYIILVTAVVALMLFFMNPKNGALQNKMNSTLDTVAGGMETRADQISKSQPLAKFNATSVEKVDVTSTKPLL